jgi:phosphoglycolate phosphatase
VKYGLVIFDFDGTLADTFPFFLRSIDELAARHGFARISGHEAEALRGQTARQIMTRVGVPLWKVPRLARDYIALMGQHLEEISLFPGVPAMMQRLRNAGVVLALVTSNAEANVRRILGAEITDHLQLLECGTSVFGKRARLKKVLRATRVLPRAALYIGDEIRDAEAARGAGMAFGAVAWGYATPAALRSLAPDEMFSTPDEIADVVGR